MRVFVSGATGFIGQQLVKRLLNEGYLVHALYRSERKADMIRQKGVELFKGDILDRASLEKALQGCEQAYHSAAFAGVWARDRELVFRLNVEASLLLVQLAGRAGIRRVVLTSTAGILGPSERIAVHEDSPAPASFFTVYEESKFKLEQAIRELPSGSPEIILVNPTRVYGPGYLSESNGVTRMIDQYMKGKWHLLPGDGKRSGNYVHVEDVVSGHLLAMEKGKPGERYVLGGENISYLELFELVRSASGIRKRLFGIPLWLMLVAANLMLGFSKLSGKEPMIVPGLVRKFNHHWIVTSEKAIRELDYHPRSAAEGIRQTVEWLKERSV